MTYGTYPDSHSDPRRPLPILLLDLKTGGSTLNKRELTFLLAHGKLGPEGQKLCRLLQAECEFGWSR